MTKQPILVVEDDEFLAQALVETLSVAHWEPHVYGDAVQALAGMLHQRFCLVISDICLPGMDGIDFLQQVKMRQPHVPVLLITAYGDIPQAVRAVQLGACDYIAKPFQFDQLMGAVHAHIRPLTEDMPHDAIIAHSPLMKECLATARQVAVTEASVVFTGESGVGKEVLSRFVHDHSQRAQRPFVAVNCAAIPDALLEAILFGHEKGAFTGAQSALVGKFELANGGTFLLDEISEIPLSLQAKLLRVIQEREVERIGTNKKITLNVRLISTSNRDLWQYVQDGKFREDLYYRLNVFPIHIPALRERPQDIFPLAQRFLQKFCAQRGMLQLSSGAQESLQEYPWPGNVRELENVIQRSVIVCVGSVIFPHHLFLPSHALPSKPDPSVDSTMTVQECEREHILKTVRAFGGCLRQAVVQLGMSERTLRHKVARYKQEGYLV